MKMAYNIDERLKQLYTDLQRQYDLTLERRKTLTGQAISMMSFTGIIETVLIAVIVASATDKDVRILLQSSGYYLVLLAAGGTAFTSYILTAIFSLLAFWEPKWYRVPQMPDKDPIVSIRDFFSKADVYSLEKFAIQLSKATSFHQKTNSRKYKNLKIAMVFLMIGIVATMLGGFSMLLNLGSAPAQ